MGPGLAPPVEAAMRATAELLGVVILFVFLGAVVFTGARFFTEYLHKHQRRK